MCDKNASEEIFQTIIAILKHIPRSLSRQIKLIRPCKGEKTSCSIRRPGNYAVRAINRTFLFHASRLRLAHPYDYPHLFSVMWDKSRHNLLNVDVQ